MKPMSFFVVVVFVVCLCSTENFGERKGTNSRRQHPLPFQNPVYDPENMAVETVDFYINYINVDVGIFV